MGLMLNLTTAEVAGHQQKALTVFRCVLSECFPFDPQNRGRGGGIAANKFKFPYTHKNNVDGVKQERLNTLK